MKYKSTRGNNHLVSFKEAVLLGLSPDGGLFIPEKIPQVNYLELQDLSLKEICLKIFPLFIGNEDMIPL
jgi:threonine synthase